MSGVSMDEVRGTYKARDSWWTVLLVDPLAGRLVQVAVGRRRLTPTRLTVAAFVLGVLAAAAFLQASTAWLVAAAVLYYLSFAVDCVDGKVARLRQTPSVVGSWLDFLLDRLRVILCTVALFTGQYLATGNDVFLFVAIGVVFLSLIGYLNGAETDKAKARMAGRASEAGEGRTRAGEGGTRAGAPSMPVAVGRLRTALHRHRIRMNLVSAVEFEMALFVVAPLIAAVLGAGAIIGVAAVAGALLVAFELALITRFWLTARSFDRSTGDVRVPAPRVRPRVGDEAQHAR